MGLRGARVESSDCGADSRAAPCSRGAGVMPAAERRRGAGTAAQHDPVTGYQALDQSGPPEHADGGVGPSGSGAAPAASTIGSRRPGQQPVDGERRGPPGQVQRLVGWSSASGLGQLGHADVTVQEHRDAVLGGGDGAEARDRAGDDHPLGQPPGQFPTRSGAALPGGVPDQRQQVGGRGLTGARVTPDAGRRCPEPGPPGATRAAPRRGRRRKLAVTRTVLPGIASATKKICTGPVGYQPDHQPGGDELDQERRQRDVARLPAPRRP